MNRCTVAVVPKIIDYADVLARMSGDGFRCLYHNSGAFGFAADVKPHVIGWVGADDPTIRPEAIPHVRRFPMPYEHNLADGFARIWPQELPGPVWIMPASHWSYELEFGNGDWLGADLRKMGINPTSLQPRNNAAAVEFTTEESPETLRFVMSLLRQLRGSDFTLAFAGQTTICTIHHHAQFWWQTRDATLATALRTSLV
jgi:hypothetical protein